MKKITLIVAACVGLCAAPGSASVTHLSIESVDFSAGYVLADGTIVPGTESIIIPWGIAGLNTVRVWANVTSPTDTIFHVGGDALTNQPLIIQSSNGQLINTASPFGSTSPPHTQFMPFDPALAWDSFITIGAAANFNLPAGFSIHDPKGALGGLSGNIQSLNAHWTIDPVPGAGVVSDGQGGWRILLAQLTVSPIEEVGGWMFIRQGISDLGVYLPFGFLAETCPADITPVSGNGAVNIDDLVAVLNQFGPCGNCSADIAPPGGNNVVNIDDLVAVLNGFGACP